MTTEMVYGVIDNTHAKEGDCISHSLYQEEGLDGGCKAVVANEKKKPSLSSTSGTSLQTVGISPLSTMM